RIEQRSDHSGEVIGQYADIAVGDHEIIVANQRHHVDEVADFAATAVLPAIDRNLQVAGRELALQAADDLEGRIISVRDAEDDLKARIHLIAKRAQTLVQLMLIAAERLQD